MEIPGIAYSGRLAGAACTNRKDALVSVVQRVQRIADFLNETSEQELAAAAAGLLLAKQQEELSPPPHSLEELMQQQQLQRLASPKMLGADAASMKHIEEHSMTILRTLSERLSDTAEMRDVQAECAQLREERDNLKIQLSLARELKQDHEFS